MISGVIHCFIPTVQYYTVTVCFQKQQSDRAVKMFSNKLET